MLIVGFSTAADEGFSHATAYGPIIAGAVVFAIAIVHSLRTKRNAIIPAVRLVEYAFADGSEDAQDPDNKFLRRWILLQLAHGEYIGRNEYRVWGAGS